MTNSFFVSDLHGRKDRFEKLINTIKSGKPQIVFVGGDLLPHFGKNHSNNDDFITDYMMPVFSALKNQLQSEYPVILIILGNDDPKTEEKALNAGEKKGLWRYIHNKHFTFKEYRIFGYNFVPPTPFQLKDWEKYDVSRFVDNGCIPPEEGRHSYPVDEFTIKNSTIQIDLEYLAAEYPMDKSIFLFDGWFDWILGNGPEEPSFHIQPQFKVDVGNYWNWPNKFYAGTEVDLWWNKYQLKDIPGLTTDQYAASILLKYYL